jgi:hypothetical protein
VVHNGEIIDLTLGINEIGNLLSNWHVSDDPSLSDHRYICFQIGNIATTRVTFRDSKRTGSHIKSKSKSRDHFVKDTHNKRDRSSCWPVATGHHHVLSQMSSHDHSLSKEKYLGTKSWVGWEPKQEGHLTQLKGQVSAIP